MNMVSEGVAMIIKHPELQKMLDEKNRKILKFEDLLEAGLDMALYRIYGPAKMQALYENEHESGFVPLPGTEELLEWARQADEALHGEITMIPFLRSEEYDIQSER